MTLCELVKFNSALQGPATFLQHLRHPAVRRDCFNLIEVDIDPGIDIDVKGAIITTDFIEAPVTVEYVDEYTFDLVDDPVCADLTTMDCLDEKGINTCVR